MKEEIIDKEIREGLKFHSLIEEDDGAMVMVFDINDDFKKSFTKEQKMKRWSNKRFEKWIGDSLSKGLGILEKEVKNG